MENAIQASKTSTLMTAPSTNPSIPTISEYFSSQISIASESTTQSSILDFDEDRSPSPSRKITKLSNQSRERHEIGGKGHFLHMMRSLYMSVPDFFCLTLDNTTDLFSITIPESLKDSLLKKEPNYFLTLANSKGKVTLMQCVDHIKTLPEEHQSAACVVLQNMMKDANWSKYVQTQPQGQNISSLYQDWICRNLIKGTLIVRSSGINEDDYGQSQAGQYDSIVVPLPTPEKILSTIFQVLASGIQKDTVTLPVFQPMAVIIQKHIDIKSGGTGFSCASLKDFSFQIRISSGSLCNTVSGIGEQSKEIQDCIISRDDASAAIPYLTPSNSKKLKHALLNLELKLGCPVDVEFGEDSKGSLWMLQARPITQLPGAFLFDVSTTLQDSVYAKGQVCSEGKGLTSGPFYIMDHDLMDVNDIPENAIVFAEQGYPSMLSPEFMKRIGGLIIPNAHANTHLAIQCSLHGVPLMSKARIDLNPGECVTLFCGLIKDQAQALFWLNNQMHLIPQVKNDIPLDLETYHSLKHKLMPCLMYSENCNDHDIPHLFERFVAQNNHLLSYLKEKSIFHNLLNSLQSIQWLMHKQRLDFMAILREEIHNFFLDFKNLIKQADELSFSAIYFINIGIDITIRSIKIETAQFTQYILSTLNQLENTLTGKESLSVADWEKSCKQIHAVLVQDDDIQENKEIQSFHQGIRRLHQNVSELQLKMNCVLKISKSNRFLSPDCKAAALNKGLYEESENQCIVTLFLGFHTCRIKMINETKIEKGKDWILECDYSENIKNRPAGSKFRLWFIVKLIQIYFEGAISFEFSIIGSTRFLKFQNTHIKNIQDVQTKFILLCHIIQGLKNFDLFWNAGIPFKEIFDLNRIPSSLAKKETDEIEDIFQLFLYDYFFKNKLNPSSNHLMVRYLPKTYRACLQFAFAMNLTLNAPIEKFLIECDDKYLPNRLRSQDRTINTLLESSVAFISGNKKNSDCIENIVQDLSMTINEQVKRLSETDGLSLEQITQCIKYALLVTPIGMMTSAMDNHPEVFKDYDFLVKFLTTLSKKHLVCAQVKQLDFKFIMDAQDSQELSAENKVLLVELYYKLWPIQN